MWGENFCISPLTDEPAKFKIQGRVLSINLKGILKEKATLSEEILYASYRKCCWRE